MNDKKFGHEFEHEFHRKQTEIVERRIKKYANNPIILLCFSLSFRIKECIKRMYHKIRWGKKGECNFPGGDPKNRKE